MAVLYHQHHPLLECMDGDGDDDDGDGDGGNDGDGGDDGDTDRRLTYQQCWK